MIDSQLRTSGVNEPWVLAAMAALPREDFVPEAQKAAAYIDRAVPLGNGRYLAAPLVHGKMLAAAEPAKTDKVLLVTSGSTYLAALLGPLVGALTQVDAADVANGIAGAPYGLIIIDGAIEQLPDALVGALADDGRIVSGLVDRGVTRLALGRKAAGAVSFVALSDLGIPVLPEFAAPKGWSF
ncbi:protein-L-isoaspartate O-methyltransferase [Novosphingobium sp. FSY-8]|uniref:Protein-L-isoaspartate O-methyltransferase n=2 Tax=Novosphingobium ovatum TaxID=1908523 RepID=A0ABW9XHG1_9SPHN|nr:protein-L-isoaspartate O-methyltransferase [Novosphingobium ovatum]